MFTVPARLRAKTPVTATRKLTWYAGGKSQLLGQLLNQTEALERRHPRHAYA